MAAWHTQLACSPVALAHLGGLARAPFPMAGLCESRPRPQASLPCPQATRGAEEAVRLACVKIDREPQELTGRR